MDIFSKKIIRLSSLNSLIGMIFAERVTPNIIFLMLYLYPGRMLYQATSGSDTFFICHNWESGYAADLLSE